MGTNLASESPITNVTPTSYIKPVNSTLSFTDICVEMVLKALKTMKSNKATGPDGIPCRILKIAAEILSPSLTLLFNRSISTGIYPDDWKMARVTPIFKDGARDNLSNYRPISIISAVAKVFGRLVSNQFYSYLNTNELITSHQSGFRPSYSTLTSLLESTNDWASPDVCR